MPSSQQEVELGWVQVVISMATVPNSIHLTSLLFSFFFPHCDAGGWTQGFVMLRSIIPLSHIPSPDLSALHHSTIVPFKFQSNSSFCRWANCVPQIRENSFKVHNYSIAESVLGSLPCSLPLFLSLCDIENLTQGAQSCIPNSLLFWDRIWL